MADNIFLASSNVHVFPCANRGPQIDLESKINTEYNLINMPSLLSTSNNYTVDKIGNKIKFVLHGYYFEINIDGASITSSDEVWVGIKVAESALLPTEVKPTTWALCNFENSNFELDVENVFKGLCIRKVTDTTDPFASETGNIYYFKILSKGNLVNSDPLKVTASTAETVVEFGTPTVVAKTEKGITNLEFDHLRGNGITGISGPTTEGLVDTYTINFNTPLAEPVTFKVTNGRGITVKASAADCTIIGEGYIINDKTSAKYGHLMVLTAWPEPKTEESKVFTDAGEIKGPKGDDGEDGFTPVATISKDTTNHTETIKITNKTGGAATTTFTVPYTTPKTDHKTIIKSNSADVTIIEPYVNTVVSVDNTEAKNVGTPTVTASSSSDSDGKVSFSFKFKELKGEQGSSVKIKGTVAKYADLPSSGNTPGDGYIVENASDDPEIGTKEKTGILYTRNDANTAWVYCGQIKVVTPATADALGLIKIGYAESDKNYAVKLDTSNKAYINVPWEDTHYTNSLSIQGNSTPATFFNQKANATINFVSGDGISVIPTTDTITISPNTDYVSSGKYRAVQVDANTKNLYTYVPWDEYFAGDGLILTGDVFTPNTSYVQSEKNYPVKVDSGEGKTNGLYVNVPWTDNNQTIAVANSAAGTQTTFGANDKVAFISGDNINIVGNDEEANITVNVVNTPWFKTLDVGGTNKSPNLQLYNDGSIWCKGPIDTDSSISAESYNATSDIRKKENIIDYKPEKSILDLPIKKFDFIDGKKNNIGCIAQDLQEICPEIVHEDKDGYLSIEENKLVYLLLDEVKKLRKEIDDLKKGE